MEEIFITGIEIKKVRHLENIKIKLSDSERKHLILTGKNGSGKTSVVNELNHMIPGVRYLDFKSNANYGYALHYSININWFPQLINWPHDSQDYGRKFAVSFFEARRRPVFLKPEGIKQIEVNNNFLRNITPQSVFLQYIVNKKATRSFAKDDMNPNVQTIEQIDMWFEKFEKLLQSIYQDNTLKLIFDSTNFNFSISTRGRESFDFLMLSDGYAAILDIITDLLVKYDYLNVSDDMQGVVLIDEIETHLHIDLQKRIMPFLTATFPKIQFIVTTHSPFVLNSIDNAVIYDLENKIQVEDLSGYSVDGIIESYFNSDKYSQKLKDKISEYEILIDKMENLSEDERDRMVELSIYFRNIPKFYAPELEVKIQQLELLKLAKK
jgi:AAA15 family ATPase/GTPase